MTDPDSHSSHSTLLPLFPLSALALAAVLTTGPPASAQETYTFESLPLNNLIDGRDNWVDQPGQGQAAISQGSGFNVSKIVRHVPTVAFNQSAYLSRVNDGNFSFRPLLPTEHEAVLQFDCTGDFLALFALGTDLDGDGILGVGELGPAFGTYDRSFRVEQADSGALFEAPFGSGNSKDDWYRIRLEIDLVANGGDGSGSLSYRNLTDGDPDFLPVVGLQDLDLGLTAMNPAATPASWNTMWLELMTGGGNTPHADNLVPNAKDPVPEPGVPYCFGDPGAGTPCPCNNDNDGSLPGAGCANGAFASGARLGGSGTASLSGDSLVLTALRLEPDNSGLFFQAENDLLPGIVWGDGLRCAGGDLKRLEVRFADGAGTASTTLGISSKAGNVSPGDTKYYQCWYRNPLGSPCGDQFNASNGYAITWLP